MGCGRCFCLFAVVAGLTSAFGGVGEFESRIAESLAGAKAAAGADIVRTVRSAGSMRVTDADWRRPDGSSFRMYTVGEGYPAQVGADFAAATNFLFSISPMPLRYRLYGGRYAGAPLRGAFSKETLPFPFEAGWAFFLDERPDANWGHPSRCVFLKGDLSAFAIRHLKEPVTAADGKDLPFAAGAERKPAPTLSAVRAAIDAHVGNAISFTSGEASKTYAILISGGYNRYNNHTRYWGDVAAVYSTLTKRYGVPKANITVCMADGNSSAADVSSGTSYGQSSHSSFSGNSSPTDLDGDGNADYSLAATKSNIQSAFTAMRSRLSADSQLFVFVTDHGSYNDYTGASSICLWNEEMMSVSEFSALTYGIGCPVWYAMEFCYSGAFVNSLANQGGVRFAAAAAGVEPSSAYQTAPEVYYMNPWVCHLVGAMRGAYPSMSVSPWNDGGSSADADANADGVISVKEAANFANAAINASWDFDETPVWRESSPGAGDGLYVLASGSGGGGGGGEEPVIEGGSGYALCVGINQYTCPGCSTLYGCVADAEAVKGMLERMTPDGTSLFAVSSLVDSGATRTAIRAAIQGYAERLQPGDTFVYYHSSHGGTDCLCAYDCEYKDAEIADDLCRFRTGVKVCIVVDSCHSGSLFNSLAAADGSVHDLPSRVQTLMQTRLGTVNLLASSIGWVTAAAADEYSYETTIGWQTRGEFTYAFCSGLESGMADSNADGWGTAYEGWDYCFGLPYSELKSTPQIHNEDVCRSVRLVYTGGGAEPIEDADDVMDFTAAGGVGVGGTFELPFGYYFADTDLPPWVSVEFLDDLFSLWQFDYPSPSGSSVLWAGRVFPRVYVQPNDDESERSCVLRLSNGTGMAVYSLKIRQSGADASVRPQNDDFAAAEELSGASGSVGGSNVGATAEWGEPLPDYSSTAIRTVWWRWTAPASGTTVFRTLDGTDIDSVMGVYTGSSVSSLSVVGENDDNASGSRLSEVTFAATAGTTYFICVAGYWQGEGDIQLGWELTSEEGGDEDDPPPEEQAYVPVNDDFASATPVSGSDGAASVVSENATEETGEPIVANLNGGATVWWSWTAPASGTVSFSTAGSAFDTVLGAYVGTSVGELSVVDEDDDGAGDGASRVSFAAVAGTTYALCVGGYDGAFGEIRLRWEMKTGTGSTYALCVGLNEYDNPGCGSLAGCLRDVENMHDVLENVCGWENVWDLTDSDATYDGVLGAIAELAAVAQPGDRVVYTHAGHGGQVSGTDVTLCLYDRNVTDAEFAQAIAAFRSGVKLAIVVDTCHSGGMFKGGKRSSGGDFAKAVSRRLDSIRGAGRIASSDIAWATATDYDELSDDLGSAVGGAFTSVFADAIRSGAADSADLLGDGDGQVSLYEALVYARAVYEHWNLTPQFCNEDACRAFVFARACGLSLSEAFGGGDWSVGASDDAAGAALSGVGWFGQTVASFSGAAARSAPISENESCDLSLPIKGPGWITFRWRVSSEASYDILSFSVDGESRCEISGTDAGWSQKTVRVSGAGAHILKWRYAKDSGYAEGEDCGWVDCVRWTPDESGGGDQPDDPETQEEQEQSVPTLKYSNAAVFAGLSSAKYVGWLLDRKGRFVGTVEVSAGKFSRSGTSSVKVKVMMAGNPKTISLSGKAMRNLGADKVQTTLHSSAGFAATVELNENSATGTFGTDYTFVCGRETKAVPCAGKYVLSLYCTPKGSSGEFRGYVGLTVDVKAKGTAKVVGTLPDGTKLSWTQKLIQDDQGVYLPVFTRPYSKRGSFGGLVVDLKARKCAAAATGIWTGTTSRYFVDADLVFDEVSFVTLPMTVASQVRKVEAEDVYRGDIAKMFGFSSEMLPFGTQLSFTGKKWNSLGDPCKLKLSYSAKTGMITGSMKVFIFGKAKSAKVNGVWLGDSGRLNVSVKGQFGFGMLIK